MKRTLPFFICIALISTTLPGLAQNARGYSRDEVVKSLLSQKNALGVRRSVCVGDDTECGDQPVKPKGFDMLLTFEFGSARLTDEARRNLDVISDALQDSSFSSAQFLIEGHTDAKGTERYNLELSNARAAAVMTYLEQNNVAPERLRAMGLGEKYPRESDAFAPGNRRVELKLLPN